jgi:hypothetical protein
MFFKLVGDKRLYAYTDANGGYEAIKFPPDFEKAVARDAVDPEILLDTLRLKTTEFSGTLMQPA